MSQLENTLKQLRLSGLLQTLDVRLQEAVATRVVPDTFNMAEPATVRTKLEQRCRFAT